MGQKLTLFLFRIGQLGGRYAHHPAWHQPFLLSWMHIDKAVWNKLSGAQQAAILRAAREAVEDSMTAWVPEIRTDPPVPPGLLADSGPARLT